MITKLSGEFAFAIYDIEFNTHTNSYTYNLWTGRDRFGIRPLFFTKLDQNKQTEFKLIINKTAIS